MALGGCNNHKHTRWLVLSTSLQTHTLAWHTVSLTDACPLHTTLPTHPNTRTSTDADWDACLVALEQVKQQNQTLALAALQNGQQQRAGAGGALHRSSFTSANSDVWHDAFSHTMSDTSGVGEADHREIEQYLAELEMLRGPAPGPELACTPSCVPNPPLMFAPAHWKYCQVRCLSGLLRCGAVCVGLHSVQSTA